MPQKPPAPSVAAQTQAGRRFLDTYYDIHVHSTRFPLGRPWCGYREYAANPELGHQPGFVSADLQCGHHETANVWVAPWVPEARYFRFDDARKRIRFAYDVMVRDEQAALDRWYDAAALLSAERGWAEIDPGKPVSYQVRRIIGPAPKMLVVAQAALAGDPWLLGFTEQPNEELARLLNWNVVRVGGGEQDRAIGAPIVGQPAAPGAPLTPAQVLGASSSELMSLLKEAVRQVMAEQAQPATAPTPAASTVQSGALEATESRERAKDTAARARAKTATTGLVAPASRG